MKMRLVRHTFTSRSTIGDLHIDGKFECHTLEDAERETKIPKVTAIPRGTYEVVVTHSPRFGQLMPLLLGVPGFEGVRIHWGNRPEHTEGCILVGRTKAVDFVGRSREAYAALFKKLNGSSSPMQIEVSGPASPDAAAEAEPEGELWYWVGSETLNLREKPNARSKVLAVLPHRHLVHAPADAQGKAWIPVQTQWEGHSLRGHVHSKYLLEAPVRVAEAMSELPSDPALANEQLLSLFEVTASVLRLRRTTATSSDANVIAGLRRGQVVRKLGDSSVSGWWEVEASIGAKSFRGFVSAAYLRALPAEVRPGEGGVLFAPDLPAVSEHTDLADPAGGALVPEEAVALILRFEGLDQPGRWPGGHSGVTIGHGYDLGYHSFSEFAGDWDDFLAAAHISELGAAIGVTGRRAQALAPRFAYIRIQKPWAESVFLRRTLPKHRRITAQALPGIHRLPPLAQGALVSLVFNRGPGMTDRPGSDRRKEMREVRDGVASEDLPAIAGAMRRMKRLWEGKGLDGLIRRREAEARLVLSSI